MQKSYKELEKQVLGTVCMAPTFDRWATLCKLMSDGVYLALEMYDQDLPTRGWLHICARYLAIVPRRINRDGRLAPNEFLSDEIDAYCRVFRPVVRSLRHYMDTIYPKFNSITGTWSRAGREEKNDNPFPFFISDYLNQDEDDDIVTLDLLFEVVPEDCGDVFRWNPEFNKVLARITDDYDAELEFCDFAGNVDEDEIKEIVKDLNESKKGDVSEEELDRVARMMVVSYEATKEMHQSIIWNKGVGRFASSDFDRSSLFHSSRIQAVLVIFQPYFLKEIERCGLKIQQYRTSICDAIGLAIQLQFEWKSFFRKLKKQFRGNSIIVEAESAALKLLEGYVSKILSEGGSLHIGTDEIDADYTCFVEKFEKIAIVVAKWDFDPLGKLKIRSIINWILGILAGIITTLIVEFILNL